MKKIIHRSVIAGTMLVALLVGVTLVPSTILAKETRENNHKVTLSKEKSVHVRSANRREHHTLSTNILSLPSRSHREDDEGEGDDDHGARIIPPISAPSVPVAPPVATTTQQPPTTQSTAIVLSAAEIAKHAVATDCWTIVSGKVYNITSYVNSHPGGVSAITSICGKDGTTAFNGVGSHANGAASVLAGFYIGNLNGVKI